MADAFAPKLSESVRFNQPVETPSMVGVFADIGSSFLKSFGSDTNATGSASKKTDDNLSTFRTGLERVEAIRDDKGEMAGLVAERQLASNFAMAGIRLDSSYEDVYTKTTGRAWAGYGQDVESTMVQ